MPASQTFYYYGDRDIVLQAPGYETQRVIQPIKAPWYDNLLTEFFTENLSPFTIRDERNRLPHGPRRPSPPPTMLVVRGQPSAPAPRLRRPRDAGDPRLLRVLSGAGITAEIAEGTRGRIESRRADPRNHGQSRLLSRSPISAVNPVPRASGIGHRASTNGPPVPPDDLPHRRRSRKESTLGSRFPGPAGSEGSRSGDGLGGSSADHLRRRPRRRGPRRSPPRMEGGIR